MPEENFDEGTQETFSHAVPAQEQIEEVENQAFSGLVASTKFFYLGSP